MIRTCRGGSRAVLRPKIRTRNTTPRGREHAGDDDGAGDQQRVARRDAARRPRNRPWRRRRPEWRRLPMHGGPPGRVPGPRLRHAPRGRRDHRHRDRDGVVRPASGPGNPVHGLHLPGLRPDRLRGRQDALPFRRPVHRPDDDPHSVRRRDPRRPLPFPVVRGVLLPYAGVEGRRPLDAEGGEGAPDRLDPRPGSGHVPGAEETVPVLPGGGPGGRGPRAAREAAVRRPGKDVSLIAYGYMAQVCLEAATKAAAKGVEAEVIDLRTLVPLDEPAVLASVKKTGRAVVVYEAPRTAGFGAEISAILAEKAIEYLRGPIVRVTGFDTPFPYALEDVYLPNSDRVLAAIDKVMTF